MADKSRKLSSAIIAFEKSLKDGSSLKEATENIKASCQNDHSISAILKAIPNDVIEHGVPTLTELKSKYLNMYNLISSLSLIPIHHNTGILSHTIAKISSYLKFKVIYFIFNINKKIFNI